VKQFRKLINIWRS